MTTCAYPRCQAGGTILPGAPRFERVGLVTGVQLSSYHHGCWAAEQRERLAIGRQLDALTAQGTPQPVATTISEHAWHEATA